MAAQGSRFIVDLGSVQLPALAEKQVETEIRDVVLRALARTSFGQANRLDRWMFDRFPGATMGLFLNSDAALSPIGPPTVEDHTLIIQSVMKFPFQILRQLGYKPGDERPDGDAVLEAALRVDQIDPFTKDRIKAVLEILPSLEKARVSMPKAALRELENLGRRLAGEPVEVQIASLRDPEFRREFKSDGFDTGMEFGAQILEDGAGTIYSPDYGFYDLISDGKTAVAKKDTVDTIKDVDYLGGVAGGAAGVAGVVTIPIGVAAGAAAASAGATIGAVIDWIW